MVASKSIILFALLLVVTVIHAQPSLTGPISATGQVAFNGTGTKPPIASFTASATSGNPNLSVTFTDTSVNSPTAWSWTFGDGGSSGAQNPTHSFPPGAWTVNFTASNGGGQSSANTNISATCSNALLQTFVGTDGNTIDVATLNSTTKGQFFLTNGIVTGPATMVYSVQGRSDLLTPIWICQDAVENGTGATGFKVSAETPGKYIISFTPDIPLLSWGYWFKCTVPGDQIVYIDSFFTGQDPAASGPSDFWNNSIASGGPGTYRMGMEHHNTHPQTGIIFQTNNFYWVTGIQDTRGGGNYQFSVYSNNAGSMVLMTNFSEAAQSGALSVHQIYIGPAIEGSSLATGFLFYANVKFLTNGTFPVMP